MMTGLAWPNFLAALADMMYVSRFKPLKSLTPWRAQNQETNERADANGGFTLLLYFSRLKTMDAEKEGLKPRAAND